MTLSTKLSTLLIVCAFLMAFGAGYLSLSVSQELRPQRASVSDIVKVEADFKNAYSPIAELKLSSLLPAGTPESLIEPSSLFPQNRRFSFATLSSLFRYQASCQPKDLRAALGDEPELAKAWTWLRFRCHEIATLPKRFFESEPWIFPLGRSYAALATATGEMSPDWISAHLPYFHVAEPPAGKLPLPPARELLGRAGLGALSALAAGEELAATEREIYLRASPQDRGDSGNPTASRRALEDNRGYRVYRRADWEEALRHTPYRATIDASDTDALCVYRQGNACWQLDPEAPLLRLRRPSFLLFLLSLGLAVLCLAAAIRAIRSQRREEERRRFALQTLTHELRTPIASLLLSSESLLDQFDRVPAAAQENLLRICEEIRRLQRLAEKSRQYLGASASGALIDLQGHLVPSIHELLREALGPYDGRARLELRGPDQPFRLDPYWTLICVRNLVENALLHGEPPVTVSLAFGKGGLEIAVSDAGIATRSGDLTQLTTAFHRAATRQPGQPGLGLGLAIVSKAAGAMRGRLALSGPPTRFTLEIPEAP